MQLVRSTAAALACVSIACTSSTTSSSNSGNQAPPGATTITIQDFTYSPSTVTIKVGQTVYWKNMGPSEHSSTADGGAWDSGGLASPGGGNGYGGGSAGGSYTYTFNTAGTYAYHCKFHPPDMYPNFKGTINVTP